MKAIALLSCFTCTTSKGKVVWSEIDRSKCQSVRLKCLGFLFLFLFVFDRQKAHYF